MGDPTMEHGEVSPISLFYWAPTYVSINWGEFTRQKLRSKSDKVDVNGCGVYFTGSAP